MKKLTKILSVVAVIAILVVSLSVFVSCDKPAATEDTTFVLEVRKADGTYSDPTFAAAPSINGEVIAQLTVQVKAGQITLAEALKDAATVDENGMYKISFNDTDYLLFSDTWWLVTGNFASVPEYTDGDFGYSYMSYNGHYSNGPTGDFVDGIKVYTIVIDGYNGTIGA
ncbi:MAG: hypothetical protein K5923_06500 [Clostridia bacterium]|nr:hypothetical protein [Clostridia bacterium]